MLKTPWDLSYIYDTTKDLDRGAWRYGDKARKSSWYKPHLVDGTKLFPTKTLIVFRNFKSFDIYDMDNDKAKLICATKGIVEIP